MLLLNLIKKNLKLSVPILLTRLIGMSSNLIAMIFMARLGTNALSASALIMSIFSVCMLLLMSFSFSICALIAEYCGKQQIEKVGTVLQSAMLLNTLLAFPFLIFFFYITPILILLHQPLPVAELTGQYFKGIIIGFLPLLWTNILEQFFIGISKPKYIVYLSLFSFLIMTFISYTFIFGKFGLHPLGMLGAGYAASFTSIINLLFLLILSTKKNWHNVYAWLNFKSLINYSLIKKLYSLGWPIALQYGGEFSAYILITLMMGWIGAFALAAQQIVLQFTSIVIMIPASISQATSVLVGTERSTNNIEIIKQHVNVSMMLVFIFMLCIGIIYLIFPDQIISIYLKNNNPEHQIILSIVKSLLIIIAFSQFFDGIKNVLSGAYRGLQETKIPMLISTIGLWLLSIPFAYILGLYLHYDALGVRCGFALGMIITTIILSLHWYQINRKIPYAVLF